MWGENRWYGLQSYKSKIRICMKNENRIYTPDFFPSIKISNVINVEIYETSMTDERCWTLLTCIRAAPGSKLSGNIGHPGMRLFVVFLNPSNQWRRIITRPRPLPSTTTSNSSLTEHPTFNTSSLHHSMRYQKHRQTKTNQISYLINTLNYFNACTVHFLLFCKITNKITITINL